MDSDEFSTWSAGKVTTEDGSLNICRKYYGVTKISCNSERLFKLCNMHCVNMVRVLKVIFDQICTSHSFKTAPSAAVLLSQKPRGIKDTFLLHEFEPIMPSVYDAQFNEDM